MLKGEFDGYGGVAAAKVVIPDVGMRDWIILFRTIGSQSDDGEAIYIAVGC